MIIQLKKWTIIGFVFFNDTIYNWTLLSYLQNKYIICWMNDQNK